MSQPTPLDQRTYFTPRAGLCALGAKLQAERFFEPIERRVHIQQKVVTHSRIHHLTNSRPLASALLSGIGGLYLTDKVVRVNAALQLAFGLTQCAQQATIQDTLQACQSDNMAQLRGGMTDLFRRYSQACRHDFIDQVLIPGLDLSGERTSKRGQYATKGYLAGHPNAYGRQRLVRAVSVRHHLHSPLSFIPGSDLLLP